MAGVNIGYGPMAVGPRWLAYAPNNPLLSNTGRLSPQNLTPSPGVSPSTSPGSGNLVARYAMESSKQLASGIINLSDIGYKTLSKYCQDLLPDGSNSPVSPSSSWKLGRVTSAAHPTEADNAGMVSSKHFYYLLLLWIAIMRNLYDDDKNLRKCLVFLGLVHVQMKLIPWWSILLI